jgi:hypothetical protein
LSRHARDGYLTVLRAIAKWFLWGKFLLMLDHSDDRMIAGRKFEKFMYLQVDR